MRLTPILVLAVLWNITTRMNFTLAALAQSDVSNANLIHVILAMLAES